MPPRTLRRALRFLAGLVLGLALLPTATAAESDRPTLIFGSLVDPSERGATESLLTRIETEIAELLERDYEVRFPEDKRRRSDWTTVGIRRELQSLLGDPEVQMVLVVGPISTAALCCLGDLPKPVFAPLAIDHEALGLPAEGDTSGVRNLNYLSYPGASFRDLETFRDIVGFDTVHVLSDPLILEVLQDLYERNRVRFEELGIRVLPIVGMDSATATLERVPADVQGIYVTPLLRMNDAELQALIDGLNDRGIPTMSLLGRVEVEMGMLAGLRVPVDQERMARRVALNVQRALFGEDPGTFSISFERTDRLVINMDTVRRIGVYPTWGVLADAELLNESLPARTRLGLSDAVLGALTANRSVLEAQQLAAAGEQAVAEVRSRYRPRLDLSASLVQIDPDRAGFTQPERATIAGATLSQVLWSDRLLTGIRAERDAQRARDLEVTRTELDVAAEAASAFLDILRFQTLERIERDNLRRVRTNLDLARTRLKIGYASRAEVYRWEVEQANGKNAVIVAEALVDAAMVRMNRLMFLPQERPFVTEAPDLAGDPYLVVGQADLQPFYNDPWSFRVFRNFMVEQGLGNAPELRQLDAQITAQERLYRQARRSFWSPTIGLDAAYDRFLTESGTPRLIGGEQQWSVGVGVGLPLYAGGERSAVARRASEELGALRFRRENVNDAIELRVRTAMFGIGASWTNIDLSREAAEASRKNLELVTDSYAKGVVSIQDLLDAQNASVTAELRAATAVYDFLLDLVEVQRATGRLDWFRFEEDREAWVSEIRAYFEEVRASGEEVGGFE